MIDENLGLIVETLKKLEIFQYIIMFIKNKHIIKINYYSIK